MTLFLVILLPGIYSPLQALSPVKEMSLFRKDNWGLMNSLPSNQVSGIAQTPDGYVWVATNKGLMRFDGKEFKPRIIPPPPYAQPNGPNEIIPRTLYVDRRGLLWMGGSRHLISYDYKSNHFEFHFGRRGVPDDLVRYIFEDGKGNLWVSFGSSYVSRFHGREITPYDARNGLTHNTINFIMETGGGDVLFFCTNGTAFKYHDGRFHPYLLPGLEGHFIIHAHEGRNGDLWLTTKAGLFRKSGSKTTLFTTGEGLSSNHTTRILEDSQGSFWVGTLKGLSRLTVEKDDRVSIESGYHSFEVYALFEDSQRNIWVGTDNTGLHRFSDPPFTPYHPPCPDNSSTVTVQYRDDAGGIWLGTLSGNLYYFQDDRLIEHIEPVQLKGSPISAIARAPDRTIWIGSQGKGVFQIKRTPSGSVLRSAVPSRVLLSDLVYSLYFDGRHRLWIATAGGVVRLRLSDGVPQFHTLKDGLSGKPAYNFCEDSQGNIWIATANGITVVKDGNLDQRAAPVHYLKGCSISALYPEPDPSPDNWRIFWVSTEGSGFKRLAVPPDRSIADGIITTYGTNEGLPTNVLYQFREDRHGYFWIMSNSGILRVTKADMNQVENPVAGPVNCSVFGLEDGLESIDFHSHYSPNSIQEMDDHELRFTTIKGISRLMPDYMGVNAVPSHAVISEITFDRRSYSPFNFNPQLQDVLECRFHFFAPNVPHYKAGFRYQLQGYDAEAVSVQPGGRRDVVYNDLPPGRYTFSVSGSNGDPRWSDNAAAYTFTLLPPVRRTSWVRLLIPIIPLAVVFLIVYFHFRRIRRRRATEAEPSPVAATKSKDPLNPHYAADCIQRLEYLMNVEHVYRNPDLNLNALAEMLNMPHYLLSQLLNDNLGKSFPEYVNTRRIQEAKRLLAVSGPQRVKITTLAGDVGFNTLPAFYKAFKKYAGMLPKEYRQEAGESPTKSHK